MTLTRPPNPLDFQDTRTLGQAPPKRLWAACRSSARLQSRSWSRPSRGNVRDSGRYLSGLGISNVLKKSTNLVLAVPFASSGPSRCPRTPRSNPRMSIGCILGVLGFPAPSAHLAGKKKASTIKEDWILLPRVQTASFRERGCLTAPYHVTSKGSRSAF
ncbi:hypothetical protein HispidOSU_008358 [Sigmodon hispidus]